MAVIPVSKSIDDLMIETTAQFKEFIKDVQSKAIGLNFDIGHFFCAGEDPRQAFEELFQWVGHVHIEDIAASRSRGSMSGAPNSSRGWVVPRPSDKVVPSSITVPA